VPFFQKDLLCGGLFVRMNNLVLWASIA